MISLGAADCMMGMSQRPTEKDVGILVIVLEIVRIGDITLSLWTAIL